MIDSIKNSIALEVALSAIDAEPVTEDNAVMIETARGLMRGYDARWSGDNWKAQRVENEFQVPIVNPDTGKSSRTFTLAGKMDGIAKYLQKSWLIEHKTTSESIEDPASPYWRRLEIDAQVSTYLLAAWQQGIDLAGTMYDVIRKPAIRPKQVKGAGRIETPQEFGQRLTNDCLERPEWYFARRSIYRTDAQLVEHAREIWQAAAEIGLARLNRTHFRNSGACIRWNSPCEYLGLCSGHETIDDPKWVRGERVHRELDMVHGDGRNVLTNSSIGCFKMCRRKFHNKYNIGLERRDRDSEALWFGQLFHHALAAWWLNDPIAQESLE